jgi:hypothetical protein
VLDIVVLDVNGRDDDDDVTLLFFLFC